MIIVVDEPTSQVKYGSVVAAPYVSMVYERILPYLDVKSKSQEINIMVDNYVGLSLNDATTELNIKKQSYEIIGNGDTIIKQVPSANDILTYPLSKILLYTEESTPEYTVVPNVVGLSLPDAIKKIIDAGLNLHIAGNGAITSSASDKILYQSINSGTTVKRGEVITIRIIKEDYED
jgi:beta-lactam-binding protein with PASTA domain